MADLRLLYTDPAVGINHPTLTNHIYRRGDVSLNPDGTLKQDATLAKTSAYTIAAADKGKAILADASGGDFTLTLPAVATAGDGFPVRIFNDGASGVVTVDGSGAELINQVSSLKLATRDFLDLVTDGVSWRIVGYRISARFRASMSAAQAVATNTVQKMQFDTEDADPLGDYDPATNYRYTPQIPGTYVVSLKLNFSGTFSAGTRKQVAIAKNGTGAEHLDLTAGAAGGNDRLSVTAEFDMNGTTDYLEAFSFHAQGTTQNVGGAARDAASFSAALIMMD